MPPDASQISSWLKERRLKAGLTQINAASAAGVGYGVVTNSEQGGEVLGSNFVALVMAYKAEDALVKQIREWREASRQSDVNNGDGGVGPSIVPRPTNPPPSSHPLRDHAKPGRKKRGA